MKHLKLFVALFAMLALGVTNAWGAEWEKVTSAPADWSGEYLLVYESNFTAYVWNGVDAANCYTQGTISSNKITGDFVSVTIATMTGGYSIKVNGGTNSGKYISGTSNSNTINFGTTAKANTLTYESSSTKIVSNTSVMRYNPQANNNRFRYFKSSSYSSQKAVQLYKKVEQSEGGAVTEDLGDALKWSATAATVQVGADDNEYPTLVNEKNVAVTYTSSSTEVATIDAAGVVTLVKEGTTTISAFYEGGEIEGVTYAAKNVSYTLTVKPAPLVIEPIEGGIIDILTHETFASTGSYTDFSDKQATNENHSDAVYAGRSARNGNATQYSIQLNTIDKGRIATTTTGGLAKRVYVKWATQGNANANARTLDIYGSNDAFTGSETSTSATKIGTITFTTGAAEAYVDLTGDYKYILMTGSGAIYMDEIQVTWGAGDTPEVPTIAAPTFSIEAGKYTEAKEVTLSAEEGTIYYTLDGTTPDAESIEYTTPIVLNECGEITIKAIAISGENSSPVTSATYTIKLPLNNDQANPYTEADAIEVYDGGCYDNQEVYVTGVVQTAQFYGNSGSYTITLEGGFKFYYFYEAAGDTQFTENYIVAGDTLVACGKLDNYKGTYQLAAGCYLVERKPYSAPKVDISNTPETAYTVAEAIALIDNVTSDLTKQVYVKGEISEIDSYNETYGSITYWIKDEEENTFQCYSGLGLNSEQFESVDDLVVGSQVVVYGTLKKHNSTYEFNYNNYIVSLTLPSYTVTVTAENGTVEGLAADGKYEHGAEATLTAIPAEGYEFTCWTAGKDTVSTENSYTFTVTADVALVANFAVVEPEVIAYELNGGELPTATVPTQEELWASFKTATGLDTKALSELSSPVLNTIAGLLKGTTWYEGFDVLEWKWLKSYIQTIQANQAGQQFVDANGTTRTVVELKDDISSDDNWRFAVAAFFAQSQYVGWPTATADFTEAGKPEAWGAAYQAAHAVVLPTEPVAEDYVLPTPVKTGYTFVGWYDNAEGTGEAYTVIPAGWSGTLYAIWEAEGPATALDNITIEGKVVKTIINGQLIIVKNGVQYNAQGQVIK